MNNEGDDHNPNYNPFIMLRVPPTCVLPHQGNESKNWNTPHCAPLKGKRNAISGCALMEVDHL